MTEERQKIVEAEVRALRRLFIGEAGELGDDARLAMGWLLREGHVFQRLDARAADGTIDALSMARLEGRRSLAMGLCVTIGLDLPGLVMNAKGEVEA